MINRQRLLELLRRGLEGVPEPEGYQELKTKLIAMRPKGRPPTINESPENKRA